MWRIPAELVTIVSSYGRRGKKLFPFDVVAARCVSFVFLPRSDATLCNAPRAGRCRAILMRVCAGGFRTRAHSNSARSPKARDLRRSNCGLDKQRPKKRVMAANQETTSPRRSLITKLRSGSDSASRCCARRASARVAYVPFSSSPSYTLYGHGGRRHR